MQDFVQSLQFIGFTARIKRLSESVMLDAKNIYKQSEFDIEPNWHLIFLLLKDQQALSVTEIADTLGFSHPAIIKITQKMGVHGYLESLPHPTDSRKKLLSLSEKSKNMLPAFESMWEEIEQAIQEIVDPIFLQKLGQLEQKLADKNIQTRYSEISNHE